MIFSVILFLTGRRKLADFQHFLSFGWLQWHNPYFPVVLDTF